MITSMSTVLDELNEFSIHKYPTAKHSLVKTKQLIT